MSRARRGLFQASIENIERGAVGYQSALLAAANPPIPSGAVGAGTCGAGDRRDVNSLAGARLMTRPHTLLLGVDRSLTPPQCWRSRGRYATIDVVNSNGMQQFDLEAREASELPSAIALSRIARAVCGLVGATAGVAGVIGVFTENASSIGVPVLLALGAFFGYIAVSGQRLKSLRMGEYEAAFDRIAHVVTHNVLENPSVPAEAKGDVAAALGEVRAELPTSTRRAVSEVMFVAQSQSLYEQALRAELRRLFPDEYAGDYAFLDGTRAVRIQRGQMETMQRSLAVAMKFVSHAQLQPDDVNGFLNELAGPMPLLLVANAPLSDRAETRIASLLSTPDYASFVQWRGPVDNGALAEAINRRLNPPQP